MKRRRKGIDKGVIILALIVVVILIAVIFLALQLRSDAMADRIHDEEPVVVAFFVSDEDSLVCAEILLYHPATSKAAVFDIPGEWGDVLESYGRMDRIDLLYQDSGQRDYLEKLENLLGLEIPWYIDMDLTAVEETVDLLDGLELFIANPVDISTGDDIVLLPAGSLVLDGAKIRSFLSYDDPDEADIERRGRYQKFIQAFLSRLGTQTEFVLETSVFDEIERRLETNLSERALRSFLAETRLIDADRIVPKHVHGDRRTVDDQILLFPHFDGDLIRETIRQTLVSLANVEVFGEDELTVILEVLNGTDRNGLAGRTAQLFSDFGYDVLPASNAEESDYEHTVVISNTGDISKAQQVASLIRCSRVEIREAQEEPSTSMALTIGEQADVTVILGLDFDGRYCQE